MEFSRQEYWNGLPFLSPGDLPYPGIKPGSPTLQAEALPSEPPGKPPTVWMSTAKSFFFNFYTNIVDSQCCISFTCTAKWFHYWCCCSVAKSDSLPPHGLHVRLPCPSLIPGVCSNSCTLIQWCNPIISFSVTLSSRPQSFLASGSFSMSWRFTSGSQSIYTHVNTLATWCIQSIWL